MNRRLNLVAAAIIVIAVCAAYVALQSETDTPVDSPEDSVPPTGGDGGEEEDTEMDTIVMTVNGREFTIVLENTAAAESLAGMLPMTLDMEELNGNEKYCYLDSSLPTSSTRPGTIHAGDVMLYGDSCLVVFYETFGTSYSYTPVGHITDTSGLAETLGSGDVTATFSQVSSADPAE